MTKRGRRRRLSWNAVRKDLDYVLRTGTAQPEQGYK
jgi:hypothetical protein